MFMSLTKCHPLYTSCGSSPWEVEKAVTQSLLLSGRYRLESLTRHWTPGNRGGLCSLPDCWGTPSSHYGNGNAEHDWKVGHYEPTTRNHGDTPYLYTINLESKTLLVSCVDWDMPDEDIDFIEHTKTEIYRRNRDTGIPEDELVEYNWLDYDTYSKVFTNFIQSSTR